MLGHSSTRDSTTLHHDLYVPLLDMQSLRRKHNFVGRSEQDQRLNHLQRWLGALWPPPFSYWHSYNIHVLSLSGTNLLTDCSWFQRAFRQYWKPWRGHKPHPTISPLHRTKPYAPNGFTTSEAIHVWACFPLVSISLAFWWFPGILWRRSQHHLTLLVPRALQIFWSLTRYALLLFPRIEVFWETRKRSQRRNIHIQIPLSAIGYICIFWIYRVPIR